MEKDYKLVTLSVPEIIATLLGDGGHCHQKRKPTPLKMRMLMRTKIFLHPFFIAMKVKDPPKNGSVSVTNIAEIRPGTGVNGVRYNIFAVISRFATMHHKLGKIVQMGMANKLSSV